MAQVVDYRHHIDPEYRRWGRKYARFPGVAECVRLLRDGKAHGSWIDIIVSELTAHAAECFPDLIEAFRTEEGEWVKLMIVMAIADARLSPAIPFLKEVAQERHPRFARYGEEGLSAIGTREARTALWEATHG